MSSEPQKSEDSNQESLEDYILRLFGAHLITAEWDIPPIEVAQAITAKINEMFDYVIGENDTNSSIETYTLKDILPIRNKLRAEQRKRKDEVLK